jgi:hypothetical protein
VSRLDTGVAGLSGVWLIRLQYLAATFVPATNDSMPSTASSAKPRPRKDAASSQSSQKQPEKGSMRIDKFKIGTVCPGPSPSHPHGDFHRSPVVESMHLSIYRFACPRSYLILASRALATFIANWTSTMAFNVAPFQTAVSCAQMSLTAHGITTSNAITLALLFQYEELQKPNEGTVVRRVAGSTIGCASLCN